LPGVDKDDLKVTLENGVLKIEASRSEEKTEEDEGKVIRKERSSGSYMCGCLPAFAKSGRLSRQLISKAKGNQEL
jgi:Hsp20/alpha crystallin family